MRRTLSLFALALAALTGCSSEPTHAAADGAPQTQPLRTETFAVILLQDDKGAPVRVAPEEVDELRDALARPGTTRVETGEGRADAVVAYDRRRLDPRAIARGLGSSPGFAGSKLGSVGVATVTESAEVLAAVPYEGRLVLALRVRPALASGRLGSLSVELHAPAGLDVRGLADKSETATFERGVARDSAFVQQEPRTLVFDLAAGPDLAEDALLGVDVRFVPWSDGHALASRTIHVDCPVLRR